MAPSMSLIPGFLKTVKHGDIFVETGTGAGGGIWEAFNAGFAQIISIDLLIRDNLPIPSEKEIHLLQGDSAVILSDVVKGIYAPATFFLDAHTRGEASPLLSELYAIERLSNNAHTILIDDLRRYVDGTWTPKLDRIIRQLLPHYDISFAPNRVQWDDILIAKSK